MNLPFIATRFPFLRSLRYYSSSRCSVFCRRKSTFSDCVLSKVAPTRLIYRRTGLLTVDSRRANLITAFACRSSVPLGGELSSSVRLSAFIELICRGVVGGGGVGIRRVERIVTRLSGEIPVARKLKSIFADVKACCRALIYIVVHSTRGIRLASRRKRASI